MEPFNSRAGRSVRQPSGYLAFLPAPLPPDPPLQIDQHLIADLSQAQHALGRLSGVAEFLPNPELFVAMYVKKEAVLSSQIEGIPCTLDEVLQHESDADGAVASKDIAEVVNYVNAMSHGIRRLHELPLSLRLIREMHHLLMQGVRGEQKDPGEFRRSQNWIGPRGATLATAAFVPPPVPDMHEALGNFEKFMHDRSLPLIIQCAVLHAQFETIHPFLDGNGRVGRLLMALMLHERGELKQPLLYLSLYLKQNRLEYYDRLTAVRQHGDWEGWTRFFLKGVAAVAEEAFTTAQRVATFREQTLARARAMGKNETALVDHLFQRPIMDIRTAERLLGSSYVTAAGAMKSLVEDGCVRETTGQKRNKIFRFVGYLNLFDDETMQPLAARSKQSAAALAPPEEDGSFRPG